MKLAISGKAHVESQNDIRITWVNNSLQFSYVLKILFNKYGLWNSRD